MCYTIVMLFTYHRDENHEILPRLFQHRPIDQLKYKQYHDINFNFS